MEPAWVEVGAVYRWSRDGRLIHVLAHGCVVMYDAWWPHFGNWMLAKLGEIKRQRISYYVTTVSTPGCLDAGEGATFNATEVVLYPFGPNGGQSAGVRVKADNGIAFTTGELLSKAAAVQAPCIGDVMPTRGVGIYRSGLHRGIPSYYLWGSEGRLNSHIASVGRR